MPSKRRLVINAPNKSKAQLWLVLPDIHFPEQDEVALEVALRAGELLKPTNTLLLGDVADCSVFSRHDRRTIDEFLQSDYKKTEVDPINKMLDRIQKFTKNQTWMLEGNHEARIEAWAVRSGGAAAAVYELINPKSTFSQGRKNFNWVPYSVPTGARRGYVQIVNQSSKMQTGGLVAVHGWSFARHAASVHLELSRSQSIVFGHTHRQQMEASRDAWTGALIKAFCPGTLSKLTPLYAVGGTPNSWTHGFALIYVGATSWTEYLISIVNGSCVLPDGREIKLV